MNPMFKIKPSRPLPTILLLIDNLTGIYCPYGFYTPICTFSKKDDIIYLISC